MCIIIYNPANSDEIEKRVLEHCARENPDGFGLMYAEPERNRVSIVKSVDWQRWDAFVNTYRALHRDGVNVLLHFRYATHGDVNDANCHPFYVPSLDGAVYDESMAAMHNGILSCVPGTNERSDTRHFVEHVLRYMRGDWRDDPVCVEALEDLVSGSKIALLDGTGRVDILNHALGITDGGTWYSNTGYKSWRYGIGFDSRDADRRYAEWERDWDARMAARASGAPGRSLPAATDEYDADTDTARGDRRDSIADTLDARLYKCTISGEGVNRVRTWSRRTDEEIAEYDRQHGTGAPDADATGTPANAAGAEGVAGAASGAAPAAPAASTVAPWRPFVPPIRFALGIGGMAAHLYGLFDRSQREYWTRYWQETYITEAGTLMVPIVAYRAHDMLVCIDCLYEHDVDGSLTTAADFSPCRPGELLTKYERAPEVHPLVCDLCDKRLVEFARLARGWWEYAQRDLDVCREWLKLRAAAAERSNTATPREHDKSATVITNVFGQTMVTAVDERGDVMRDLNALSMIPRIIQNVSGAVPASAPTAAPAPAPAPAAARPVNGKRRKGSKSADTTDTADTTEVTAPPVPPVADLSPAQSAARIAATLIDLIGAAVNDGKLDREVAETGVARLRTIGDAAGRGVLSAAEVVKVAIHIPAVVAMYEQKLLTDFVDTVVAPVLGAALTDTADDTESALLQ